MLQRPPLARHLGGALLASLAAGSSLGAQAFATSSAVNARSDSGSARAPHFFASAAVAPAGTIGLSLYGASSHMTLRTTEFDGAVSRARASGLSGTASAVWGATSFLTFAPYISASRVKSDFERSAVPPDEVPTRQGTRTGLEADEFGLVTRASLFRSRSGATRLGVSATVFDRVDLAPSLVAGVALQQSLGRVTIHAAPTLQLSQQSDSRTLALNGAAVFAATARVGLSVEAQRYRSWLSGWDLDAVHATFAGTALRYHVGRLAIDGGFRALLERGTAGGDLDQFTVHVGTHWSF